MKSLLKYILTLFFIWMSLIVHSSPTAFRNLTVTEGLSDLLVNAIYKDSMGYVWVGTGNSLERFDGVHIKRFSISGANEKLKRVSAIVELPGNEIWMGNGMGLWRVDKKGNILEPIVRDVIDIPVHSLLSDSSGTLYIGTDKGLYIYSSGRIQQLLIDANILSSANVITGMTSGDDNYLWMATEGGLYALNLLNNRISEYHNQEGELHICQFKCITKVGDYLYLATQDQGIVRFDLKSKQFERYIDVGCNVISSLSTDGNNMLYVGTDGNGIHFIDTRKNKIIHSVRHDVGKDGGLHSNSVYSLLVDKEGIIWVGYYQQGLDYTLYQNGLFTPYSFMSYLDTRNVPVRALYIHGNEKLIGSRDGLYYINEKDKRFKSFKSPLLRSNMIFSILYHRGEYYVGTYGGGMYILNPESLEIRDFDPDGNMPFSKGQIFTLKEDAEGALWIGTSEGVFCYRNGEQIAHYTSANSKLPAGNVYEIYFDSTRKGWICTENGLCVWDPSSGTIRTDVFPDGFIHKEKVRVVYEDSDHQLYFFPDKGGMFISDLGMTTFHSLQPDTPLDGRNGMSIIEDSEHWLWIATDKGLFRYDKKERFVSYDFVDGIPNPIFTLYPSIKDKDGNLWFTNTKGLLCLNMSRLYGNNEPVYPLTITDVLVNGSQPVLSGDVLSNLKLDSSQKNITFCFSDFSYTAPAYMSYEYQLVGEDKEWKSLQGASEVTYYNLDAGTYTFKVRQTGNMNSEVQTTVKITPSGMWRVVFAICLSAVMLLSLGIFYKHYRFNHPSSTTEYIPMGGSQIPVEDMKNTTDEKYKTNRISQDECKRLAEALEKYMQIDKPYTNPNLKLGDLASALNTSSHTLSYLFSQYLNCSYYDYVTGYRINEFKRLVKSGEYSKYTLSALAELCGFNSRASFFRSFKKVTGVTPNEYISRKEQ